MPRSHYSPFAPKALDFPFNPMSEEVKQCLVKGFLCHESLEAQSPKLLQPTIIVPDQGLSSQGPGFAPGWPEAEQKRWGSASPKDDRWAGWPQHQPFEQPFYFPTKHAASVPFSPPRAPADSPHPPFCLWASSEEPKGSGRMGAAPLYDWEMMKGGL